MAKKNVGEIGGKIRIILGTVLLGTSIIILSGYVHLLGLITGIYLLVTGTFRACIIHDLIGFNK